MNFSKDVLILKQTVSGYSLDGKALSGIFRLEQESGVFTIFLTTINARFNSCGEYALYFFDGKELYKFNLGSLPQTFSHTLEFCPNAVSGFSVGIAFESNGIPIIVAFSKTENCKADFSEFKSMVSARALKERKNLEKEQETNACVTPTEDFVCKDVQFDDEAVATENYYAIDEQINEKLKTLEEQNGRVQPEICNDDYKSQDFTQENKEIFIGSQIQDERDFSQKYSKDFPYYNYAKRELEEIFNKFPIDLSLTKLFPDSTFVRINYSSDKYYVVGVIKENKKEKYICYGVPSPYSEKAPKELEGFCSFIPLSIFETKGDGYFMMFQDAITGECIKKD
ncbi:MAG: hypothetical protein IKA12_01750 [Clostridia bacterium]|nr:hypothetical protein [Clostridia bacterium]